MLNVSLPVEVEESLARLRGETSAEPPPLATHVTLAFLGRDVPVLRSDAVRVLGAALAKAGVVPRELTMDGRVELFGKGGDHVVAMVHASEELLYVRGVALRMAREFELRADERFRPHVTVALLSSGGGLVGERHETWRSAGVSEILRGAVLTVTSVAAKRGSETDVEELSTT